MMATLFGNGTKGKLSTEVKYTELPQHFSDEDVINDEDELLFVHPSRNGDASLGNGNYRHGEVIELGNLGGTSKSARQPPIVEVRQAVIARKCVFISSILGVAIFVIVLALGIPHWSAIYSGIENATWTAHLKDYGSESCVRLVDVDGDGLLDVLMGMGSAVDLSTATDHDPQQFCTQTGRAFPCLGVVIALKGTNGKELWRTFTDSAIFLMNCEEFDIDQDGKADCIMSGRQGTIVAINPRTGNVLWTGERKHLKRQWNIYQVSALPDLDGDGVAEVLVPHGGEPRFPPEKHDRNPGRLLILSGKTGKSIGTYLDMPDSKEIYITPVIYTFDDGSQFILFGSGGETVPGDFMAISVKDFYKKVTNSNNVKLNGSCNQWDNKKTPGQDIITIFKGKKNGVMVPPIVIDVNQDGIKDILMSAFEGTMILFDGKDLTTIWTLELPGCQAYSTSAPGYFDGDDTPDFITSWNNGTWPDYKYSFMLVISGKDGAILWRTYAQQYNMASPLTLATKRYHQDAFLFELVGREMRNVVDINGAIHGIVPQRNLSRRESGSEYENWKQKHIRTSGKKELTQQPPAEEEHITCESDLTSLRSEVFLMDRTSFKQPILVWSKEAEKYNYTFSANDRALKLESFNNHRPPGSDPVTTLPEEEKEKTQGLFCTVLKPSVLNTGAIADVDGDGRLDYIIINSMLGLITDSSHEYIRMAGTTYVSKVNLVSAVDKFKTIHLNTTGAFYHTGSSGKRFEFEIYSKQKWTQYMGTHGNGVYP